MSLDLRVQYGVDTVTILEFDDGQRYEVARWTEDELETAGPELQTVIENAEELVKTDPERVLDILYGGRTEWERERENRKW